MNNKIVISNIYKFLKLVYYDKNASREEFRNFLNYCLQFVFTVNELDISNYNIVIHDAKPISPKKQLTRLNVYNSNIKETEIPPYEICFMWQDEKNLNNFHVCFNRNETVFKFNDFYDYEDLTIFIYFAFHEFAHIIQYITCADSMEYYNYCREAAHTNIPKHAEKLNKKTKSIIIREFKKYVDSQATACKVERDANAQAYYYFSYILKDLINQETDLDFKDFLNCQLLFLNRLRKEDYASYRKANKERKEAISKLTSYGVDEGLYLID